MTHTTDYFDFSRLSAADRLLLAQELLDSVLAPSQAAALTPDQIAEIRRRDAAIDAGEIVCEPWDVVRERLLKK